MDYDVEMLKLYFLEQGFTKKEINYLLNNNPFDKNYVTWEKNKKRENKIFADTLKKNRLINPNMVIEEIAIHENNMVGLYLPNTVQYTKCSIDKTINKIPYKRNLILINGIYKNEAYFLKKLDLKKIPFIIGVCSKNRQYYKKSIELLKELKSDIKALDIITKKDDDHYIFIAKKM